MFDLAGDFGEPIVNFSGPTVNKWYNTNQVVRWTITDTSGDSGRKPTGIAGFSQAWDTQPGRRRPKPGSYSRRRQLLLQRAAVPQPVQWLPRFSGFAVFRRLRPGLAYGERASLG